MNLIGIAVSLISLVFTQIHTQNVICDFETIENDYICTIVSANITSDTIPLEFLSQHLDGRNDSHVTVVKTNSSFSGRISIYHPQFTQQFPNLQVIDLQRLRIMDLSNSSFQQCDELRKINLHFNELNYLQDNLFDNCIKLVKLILSNNHIQVLTDATFYGLHDLEVMNINLNLIHTISDNVFRNNRKLKELHLGNPWNLYQYNPRMLEYLQELEVIELSDWHINFNDTEIILNGLTNLREIILRKNYYDYLNFEFFSQFENLMVLDLNDNSLRDIVDYSMQNLTNLKELYIQGSFIQTLTENTFTGLDNLEILWLGYNNIDTILENTFSNLKNLKELSLIFNKIDVLQDGIFQNQQNLQRLHLGVNMITDLRPGVFEPLTSLESINIYNNNIKSLNTNAFGKHEHLTEFTASWNEIYEIERNFFENFPNLQLLVISKNICIDKIIENFQNVNVSKILAKCFENWVNQRTTTSSTEFPTTTDGGDNGSILTYSILLIISLIFAVFIVQ
ncbi:leucine-rich repeat-containing protein 15-like isoform X2 [Chironomus tepperi]|uniref:leucine-rich repeat-containing protein 15-like isoform X2 n=1 Tax=Chironomus tepperi TaxID=113505 RepID=UPI00391F37C8